MNEEQAIDTKLIEIEEKILLLLDYNHYSYKSPAYRLSQFYLETSNFHIELQTALADLPVIPYLLKQINDLSESLSKRLSTKTFKDVPQTFINARSGEVKLIRSIFNSIISRLSKQLLDSENNENVKIEDCALNSFQLALFILYLRDEQIISSKVSDSVVAGCFNKLTSYSGSKLRNLISGTNKSERNQITELESNYNELITILSKIIKDIEADKRKANLKKAK